MSIRKIPFVQLMKAGYNRGISRAHVNKIKRDFHEDMVQPAIVSFRDGKYWVIDHQHQSQAIYELNGSDPDTLITCEVKTGLTYEQEADLYYRLNTGSKQLSSADKIIGQVEAKDPKALEFRDIVETYGYVIGGSTNNTLRAVSAAWNIFNKKDGTNVLAEILSITNASWPNQRDSAQADIIRGLDMFLKHHRHEYKRQRLIKALSLDKPQAIVKKGDTYCKQMDSKSHTKPYCVYSVIVQCYNSGLRRGKLETVPAAFA